MITINAFNVPEAFAETMVRMRHYLVKEESRNGPVHSFQSPLALIIRNPLQRVLTDATRDANPFFHVMEFCWMMAGSNDIKWIAAYNRRMLEYSDDGQTQHAAYGYRWRKEFQLDQVKKAITMLRKNKNDRRIVISMWDPQLDLGYMGKDIPCNTHIYLRVVSGQLDMTVCNRSNDIVWGMLGANAAHMTMLHELIAQAAGLPVGYYRVMSNNAHIYESVPNFEYYVKDFYVMDDVYARRNNPAKTHIPLLKDGETYTDFVTDCENLVRLGTEPPTSPPRTFWMKNVAAPMAHCWWARKLNIPFNMQEILADDWRIACAEWIERRKLPPLDNQRPDYITRLVSGEQKYSGMGGGTDQSVLVVNVDNSQPDVGTATSESGTVGDVSP